MTSRENRVLSDYRDWVRTFPASGSQHNRIWHLSCGWVGPALTSDDKCPGCGWTRPHVGTESWEGGESGLSSSSSPVDPSPDLTPPVTRAALRAEAEVGRLRAELDAERAERIRALIAIQAVLGNGADEDAWPPGTHYADALGPFVEGLRVRVGELEAENERLKGEAAHERN